MPKGIKTQPSPIKKKIQEICEDLYLLPAPNLIASIEENLVSQINEEMVLKAHQKLLGSRKDTKPNKETSTTTTQRKTSTPATPSLIGTENNQE